jgi:hypothetical protein
MSVMMDLVVNHVPKDCLLVAEHPSWFRRDPAGSLLSPSVTSLRATALGIDHDDGRRGVRYGHPWQEDDRLEPARGERGPRVAGAGEIVGLDPDLDGASHADSYYRACGCVNPDLAG